MLRAYADNITPRKRGSHQELNRIAQLEGSALADLKLSAITRRVLRNFRDQRLKEVCGASWNRQLSLISQILKYAVREHDAKVDVRALTEGLRGQESAGRTGRITPADEAKLMVAGESVTPWCPAMIRLSLALGTRRGELFSLRHEDVDRQNLQVHVKGTKTKASDRWLPISVGTLAAIDALPRSLADDRIFWQAASPDSMTFAWRRAARDAGLPHIVLHLARHECLSRLAEGGVIDILKLRSFSGHQTLSMLGRYARPEAEGLRALVAA